MGTITLTTDFGSSSPYVAEMKGVILSIHAEVQLVDVTHAIPPQDITAGGFVLAQTIGAFAPEAIHIAVVDPGVGTSRRIVLARIGSWWVIGPDNGLLVAAKEAYGLHGVWELNRSQYWRPQVSATFHGRDVMAPVAAHLSSGVLADEIGDRDWSDTLQGSGAPDPSPTPEGWVARVMWVDGFGNLVTNLDRRRLGDIDRETVEIRVGDRVIRGLCDTFGERPAGEWVAYIGSGGYLEIARVNDHAAQTLQLDPGAAVELYTHK